MKVGDLDNRELMEIAPQGGVLRFAGQRAVLLDALSLGRLRQVLLESLDPAEAAKALMKMGFVCGWHLGEAAEQGLSFDDQAEARKALPRLVALQGIFGAGSGDPLDEGGLSVDHSVEAEQVLLETKRAPVPVCHTAAGLIAGYLSRVSGRPVEVIETRCAACGDANCTFQARTLDQDGFPDTHDLPPATTALDALLASLPLGERDHDRGRATPTIARSVTASETGESSGIFTHSDKMQQVVKLASLVARVDASVLISGETGVGKERIARFIHDQSSRTGPFIAVNCGAITETLLESELFGHARGAFTGASHEREGLFEAAHNGTLLLDEIGEISPAMQVKLLRVLQQREVRRVGENLSRPVDVRVISATNRNLTPGPADLGFRQDLYYRIKVVELIVPPLRHRREDILPLARALLEIAANRMGRELNGMTAAVAEHILKYPWPGNVRELENVMERAAALAQGDRIELHDLPEDVVELAPHAAIHDSLSVRPLDAVFRECIMAAMAINDGNQRVAAAQLGISTATLYRKLKRYGELSGP